MVIGSLQVPKKRDRRQGVFKAFLGALEEYCVDSKLYLMLESQASWKISKNKSKKQFWFHPAPRLIEDS
jgi:hypothetical protein